MMVVRDCLGPRKVEPLMARYTVNVYAPTLGVETVEVEAIGSHEANVIARAIVRRKTGTRHLTSQVTGAEYGARAQNYELPDY